MNNRSLLTSPALVLTLNQPVRVVQHGGLHMPVGVGMVGRDYVLVRLNRSHRAFLRQARDLERRG